MRFNRRYIANILYAVWVRKFSKLALSLLVAIAAIVSFHFALTNENGDVTGGWTLNFEQVRVGLTRTIYPFFAGVLLSRVVKPANVRNAFPWCSLLIIVVLFIPRIGGADHFWLNGLYEALCIVFLFPVIVYLGASGKVHSAVENKVCRFLGDISYPMYMVHYPLVYFYVAWVSNHKGVTIAEAWPYALLTFSGAILLAYLSLKLYDEPARAWLRKKLR